MMRETGEIGTTMKLGKSIREGSVNETIAMSITVSVNTLTGIIIGIALRVVLRVTIQMKMMAGLGCPVGADVTMIDNSCNGWAQNSFN